MTTSRKPLRRTAWSLTVVGAVVSALMLGGGEFAVRTAPGAGPGQEATWPAGETVMLDSVEDLRHTGTTCTVTQEGRRTASFPVDEPISPDFTGTATLSCDEPVVLLTGTRRVVAEYTRNALVTLPVFVTLLGIALFFPFFTKRWASNETRGNWILKAPKIPPPKT